MSELQLQRRPDVARAILVRDVRHTDSGVSAVVEVGRTPHPVYLRSRDSVAGVGADPFVPLTLLPALVLGADVRIEGAVTAAVLDAAQRVQSLFGRWFPSLRPVRIEAAEHRLACQRAPGVVSLFSGGVDSFHAVLEERAQISHLLYVLGFDVPVGALGLGARVSTALGTAAAEIGLPLLEIETNLREFLDPYVPWGFAHGAAITAAAMLVRDRIGEVRIPSSATDPVPWGSHAALDPLWTTPEQEFVHYAGSVDRLAKLRAIVGSDTAMRYLRVCWRNPEGAYNCGRCEKCLRTLTGLRLLGAESRCRSLPGPLDLAMLRRVRPPGDVVRPTWRTFRQEAHARGDAALAGAIRASLRRDAIYRTGERTGEWLRRVARRVPGGRSLWRRLRGWAPRARR